MDKGRDKDKNLNTNNNKNADKNMRDSKKNSDLNPTEEKIELLKTKRKELGMTYETLAAKSGVPLGTIQKIFGGYTKNPRYDNMLALEQVLVASPQGYRLGGWNEIDFYENMKVYEEAFDYYKGAQGPYTVDDLENMEDDTRYELVDGFLYAMATPTIPHQIIISELFYRFSDYIKKNGGPCLVIPPDASLNPKGNKSDYLIPDLSIVCNWDVLGPKNFISGPDLVVEVLSPSTRTMDLHTKVKKYDQFGVREYWVVDGKKEKIIIYKFSDVRGDMDITTYTFDDKVPVGIFDDKLKVDFREIRDLLGKLPK